MADTSGKPGILHVKCVVGDGHRLFPFSAYLTRHAISLNMELGVLITGGHVPLRVERMFDRLSNDSESQ